MWKEEIKKQTQLQKDIEEFVNAIDRIQREIKRMNRLIATSPRADRELRKVFKSLQMAEDALRNIHDEE
tara:strand:+ start:864 stop:1070 length:207 start_codon:yes stop_codon:yes gene_type:complete